MRPNRTLSSLLIFTTAAVLFAAFPSAAEAQSTTEDTALKSLSALQPIDAHVHVFKTDPAFQDMLAKYANREGVLAVGHNPNLFQFLGRLVTGNGGANLRMRKASVARVDLDRHPPQLQWLIDPRTARLIYLSVGKSSRPKTSRK